MSHDVISKMGHSTVQMGSFNDRIYLMSLAENEGPEIVRSLIEAADKHDLSKIFAKVPLSKIEPFLSCGFEREAQVKKLFKDDDGVFLGFYRHDWRKKVENKIELDSVIVVAESKRGSGNTVALPAGFRLRRLAMSDADSLAALYGGTFKTYPFPVTDSDFIRQEMAEGVCFMGVFSDEKLVGAASAEISSDGHSAEMTDFAVNPLWRKMGIAGALLHSLEKECSTAGVKCFFTIARACSYGINSLFSKGDYEYSGRLINNTNISGGLESMNVWYKVL